MRIIKEELETSRNWIWFKAFEKKLLANLLKAQDFFLTWRSYLRSAEFWSLSWLWTSLLLKLCSLRIRLAVGGGVRRKLMSWMSTRVPKRYLTKSFPTCFKDGILLCALTENLVPGACLRFDLLDPDQPLRNLRLALFLVEKYIKIRPPVTAEEIFEGGRSSEKRLLLLVAQMKLASEKFRMPCLKRPRKDDDFSQTTFVSDKCFARGMGLLLAVRGRKACFTILLDSTENLDMVIEIRGPKNTACNKRITSLVSLCRSDSAEIRDIQDAQIQQDILSKRIPLSYRILGRKISVNYTPIESGTHNMSIIWQGQHIMGSPYTITVDTSVEASGLWYMPPRRGYSPLKRSDSQYFDESCETHVQGLASCPESAGTVTRKRILRYIVRIEGNDVVIDGKEDLCAAIAKIKQQLKNAAADREENAEVYNCYQTNEFKTFKSIMEADEVKCSGKNSLTSAITKSKADQQFRNDSPYRLNNKELINQSSEHKNIDCLHKSSTCGGLSNKNNDDDRDSNENRKVDESLLQRISTVTSIKTYNQLRLENLELKHKKMAEEEMKVSFSQEKNSNETLEVKDKSKLSNKVSFSDDVSVECVLDDKNDMFSNTESKVNAQANPKSLADDANFFPVHKVDYEMLQDNDDDLEDQGDYNPNRRTSFTELHESNYLDDIEHQGEVEEESLSSLAEINDDSENDHGMSQQRDIRSRGIGDARKGLRVNHALFQCDHSLGFWSETVTETPPEFAPCGNNEVCDVQSDDISKQFEDEILEAAPSKADEVSSELDNLRSGIISSLEYEEKNSVKEDVYEMKGSDFYYPVCFSPQCSDSKKYDDDLEMLKKSLLQELPDNKKRSSWPEREHLPAIRESSVEDLLDLEIHGDKLRSKEINRNVPQFNVSKIQDKLGNTCTLSSFMTKQTGNFNEISKPLSPSKTEESVALTEEQEKPMHASEHEENSPTNSMLSRLEYSQKLALFENAGKCKAPSMTILSASPYKNKSQENYLNFSTKNNAEKFQKNSSTTNEFSSTSAKSDTDIPISPKSQNLSNDYILTYASPVIFDELQNENDASEFSEIVISERTCLISDEDADNLEAIDKPPQCLSVKTVIKMFQKEKTEPVDSWPRETQSFKPENRKLNEDSSKKTDSFGSCFFAPCGEISRSSIRDRVKLFENDESRNSAVTRNVNNVKKRASSSVSAKKDYWEKKSW